MPHDPLSLSAGPVFLPLQGSGLMGEAEKEYTVFGAYDKQSGRRTLAHQWAHGGFYKKGWRHSSVCCQYARV